MNGSLTANLNLTPWPFGIENGEYYTFTEMGFFIVRSKKAPNPYKI